MDNSIYIHAIVICCLTYFFKEKKNINSLNLHCYPENNLFTLKTNTY